MPFCCGSAARRWPPRSADCRALADGVSHTDLGFHLNFTAPTPQVLGGELLALIAREPLGEGLHGLRGHAHRRRRHPRHDGCRARHGAKVMVHRETTDVIAFLSNARPGDNVAPRAHATTRPVAADFSPRPS